MEETYPYTRTCLYCNETFQGRRNAKFCHPTHKALYHAEINRQKKKKEEEKFSKYKGIMDILIKNCETVQQLKSLDHDILEKQELLNFGINFSYYTHLGKRGEDNLIWWFDHGLRILGNGKYQIITK